ncbi:MAG: hypothetical protein IJR17_05155 [Clostridia bacterium]|nr:hypothetical protein [Clostridia bacterium]
MKERLRKFMEGRYGNDQLNQVLSLMGWVLLVLGMVLSSIHNRGLMVAGSILIGLAWAALIWSIYRTLSKRTADRAAENYRYFVLKNRCTGWLRGKKNRFKDRKQHRYYRCSQCRTTVRVPRGKGKIRITCPKCGNSFIKMS